MPSAPPVLTTFSELVAVLDRQPLNSFHLRILVLSFLVAMADGYDLSVVGLIASPVLAEFHASSIEIGWLFSCGLAGMVFGTLLFAYVGDRFGRKTGVASAAFAFGAFTLASAFCGSLWELALLRFLTGIGMAGIIPSLVALNAEYLPARVKSLSLGIVLVGVPTGGALAAWLSGALLVPHGWRSLLVVGGVWPLVLSMLVWARMPESIRYLALRPGQGPRVEKLLRATARGFQFNLTGLRPVLSAAQPVAATPGPLLSPEYRWSTLSLWALCFLNYGIVYFLGSWLPMALNAGGFTPGQIGLLASLGPLGGILGSLVVSALIRRWGIMLLAALFCAGVPVYALLGSGQISFAVAAACSFASGVCTIGCQTGLIVVSGLLYRTEVRVRGAGWAAGVGRLGSVLSPLAGGVLMTRVPVDRLMSIPVAPLVVCLLVSVILAWRSYQRYEGLRLPEVESAALH